MSPNPLAWSFRVQYALGFVCCFALLAYALYVQHAMFLDPCPLCILQRIAFAGLALLFLAGVVLAPRGAQGRRALGIIALIPALIGVAIAGRHVWLQSLPPDQVPACGPGLEYMLDAFPLSQTLRMVLTGSGECANVDWQFAGLSMPAWTLIWFILLGALAAYASFRRR